MKLLTAVIAAILLRNDLIALLRLLESQHRKAARAQFELDYPDIRVASTSARKRERERFIVAVFWYAPPPTAIDPLPYQVYAVSRGSSLAEELSDEESLAYQIRGRK